MNAVVNFFRARIFPILLVNFIGILGYSLVIPILIYIVQDFGGNGFIYGILGAMYPFFQFIGAPILGKLSDRLGRKKVLIISQVGTFLAWCLFLLAFILPETELWTQTADFTGSYIMTLPLIVIFVARILDGFTGGNISVANAYLSDISTDEDRNRNFGKMGSSTSLAFVLGPAVAGILATTFMGVTLPLLLAAIISLIAIFIISTRLKESNPCIVDTKLVSLKNMRRFFQVEHKDCYTEGELESDSEQSRSWRSILRIPGIPLLYAIYFLTFFGFSLFYAGLPIYASTLLEWSAQDLGLFLAYSSFLMIIVQGPVLNYLSGFMTNLQLVLIGSLLLCLSFYLLHIQDLYVLYGANTILSLGNGLMWPSFLAMLSGTGPRTAQGSIQGYGTSMGSFASMIGLVMGGLLFENLQTDVFMIASGLMGLISVIVIIRYIRRRRSKPVVDLKD